MSYYSLVGTDRFSNCKACGRKVPADVQSCPYCEERNPQMRNFLGWRINYTKSLDPSVASKRRSIWPFRTRLAKRIATYAPVVTISVILVADYFMPELTNRFFHEHAQGWAGLLYVAMYVVLVMCVVVAIKGSD